jgi:two-component system chemotaxis response regulator CheB
VRVPSRAGGRVVVQHPDDSPYPSMPLSTLASTPTAAALPLAGIAAQLVEMLGSISSETPTCHRTTTSRVAPDPLELDAVASEAFTRTGKASSIACPECKGGIFEMEVEGVPHFRCRVGHAYSAESLYLEHRASLETALWTALRALEGSAELARRLVTRSAQRGNQRSAESFQHNADVYTERAELIRGVLRNGLPVVGESEQPTAAH